MNAMTKIDENVLATGDDAGRICLWDHRIKGATHAMMEYSNQMDYISSIIYVENEKKLLCTRYEEGKV
jgi:hypothetical protein